MFDTDIKFTNMDSFERKKHSVIFLYIEKCCSWAIEKYSDLRGRSLITLRKFWYFLFKLDRLEENK